MKNPPPITKKGAATISLLLCLVALLAACTEATPPEPEHPPLRVEWTYWPGYYPMAIAVEQGLFEKHGVEVEALLYDSGPEALADFSAKKLDAAMFVTGDVLKLSTEVPLKVVLAVDYSAGADQVVARPDIASVADLRGKRISYTLGDFGELFIRKMLEQNGLTTQDVIRMNVDPEDVPDAIEKDIIEAGNTWEPYTTKALASGYHVIFSSADTPGLIMDVVTFHASVVEERPDDIRAFNKAWFEAVEFWENNPEEAAQIIAKHTGLKPEEVSKEGVKIFDLADNKVAFKRSPELTSAYTSAQAYIDLFIANGTLGTTPDLDELFDSSFLE